MNQKAYPGFFITLEGGEGGGKTTQGQALRTYLESMQCRVFWTREPGGPPIAERIREILLDPQYADVMAAETELLLYAAARAQHVAEWIRPALAEGKVVISDRYADATLAYQGYGRGLSTEKIQRLHMLATDGLNPDLTLLLDLPPEIGLERARRHRGTADRLELETLAFHRRVRNGYRALAVQAPERICLIDATQPIEQVQAQIRQRVVAALTAKGLLCSQRLSGIDVSSNR